ncbi:type II toxin-antitoxin system VapC family toxin [Aquibium sp. A9E412]|uniref:type II toxin-antitoxin system VapC family toxin n=1 Tax=Aquibium sp. A9E412 TaxID=2976767 RepID=UPI0025B06BED|nr:type II toxin-antitoxin system VapC family toxin [Aquibium sp. A9E412]MDN2566227.1 type II toxin-antitoxin system VapC family toxin [Aquibium sp. A9E412]
MSPSLTFLIDTHILLWTLADPDRLSQRHAAIVFGSERLVVSVVTLWEIEIKRKTGKLEAPGDAHARLVDAGVALMPILAEHAVVAGRLPLHHRDPFDRMLVAQASVEGLTLVTVDPRFSAYDVALT